MCRTGVHFLDDPRLSDSNYSGETEQGGSGRVGGERKDSVRVRICGIQQQRVFIVSSASV